MIKRVNAVKARRNLGQLMNEVNIRGDYYLIERDGKPIAALVPINAVLKIMRKEKENSQTLQEYSEAVLDNQEIYPETTIVRKHAFID